MKRTRLVALFALASLAAPCFAQIALTGAGATFPNPIYSKWFYEYQKMHKEIQINYQALGSGAGIRQVTEGTVDFGATDGPMNQEQMKAFEEKRHTNILHFPTVLGSDVPIYNLRGISNLNFTGELLADIFLGKVTKWDDPAIARINAGVKLPKADIIVVHRAESSGTTYVWTDFLSKASPLWLSKVGRAQAVNWPVGLAGKGNDGVTGEIRQTPNSLGYVELNYAIQNHIAYGAVRNKSGKFIKADLASTTAGSRGRQHARGFPYLDHGRRRGERLPDLHFHLASDSGEDPGSQEARRHPRISAVDARAGTKDDGGARLRAAAPERGGQGTEGHFQGALGRLEALA